MNKSEIKIALGKGPEPKRLIETQQLCVDMLSLQPLSNTVVEKRTNFWQFLSNIIQHIGWRLWGLQGVVLLLVCAGIYSIPNTPKIIPFFMPLFILACLPSLYQNRTFGMCEIEAATMASGAQIMLAKLVLAGAGDMICLTLTLALTVRTAEYDVNIVQLIMYALVPFWGCMVTTLWSIRTCKTHAIQIGVSACLGAGIFAGCTAHWMPQLYELSAIGIWFAAFIIFSGFFIKEIFLLMEMRKEGKMYGIIA
ncbi:hypothetical protein [Oscillibacter sp.]|uniref:hypothetical protein n=1 Tax=Oscillibacter sp. TaxID=1945593 RepID=UPI0028AEEDEB|nr:hypothetical protein [Oscillibacter sp.]